MTPESGLRFMLWFHRKYFNSSWNSESEKKNCAINVCFAQERVDVRLEIPRTLRSAKPYPSILPPGI